MVMQEPVTELIKRRFSCRSYLDEPIAETERRRLLDWIAAGPAGPFDSPVRFALVAATEQDRRALKGLGTYGFIKGATGFIVGAVEDAAQKGLEDFGYLMEEVILLATDLGLGTCWLGGTFTKSGFADKIAAKAVEIVPAVASVGYIATRPRMVDRVIRRGAGADRRFPWERLFFQGAFGVPISPEQAGAYAVPLEMVRLAPSASNKQPWRILQEGHTWHFYLQRTPGYRTGTLGIARLADLQRVDMGIAMCHFELTAKELGLRGKWVVDEPGLAMPDERTEYTVSWAG